jgi:hypothetical protein
MTIYSYITYYEKNENFNNQLITQKIALGRKLKFMLKVKSFALCLWTQKRMLLLGVKHWAPLEPNFHFFIHVLTDGILDI